MGDIDTQPYSPVSTYCTLTHSRNPIASPIKHILIICINGFSIPTDKTISSLKNINQLMQTGTYTRSCRSVYPTESLPNLASFFFSADPVFTGIYSDDYNPYHSGIISSEGIGSYYPNLFSVIRCNLKNNSSYETSNLHPNDIPTPDASSKNGPWKFGVFLSYGINNPVSGVVSSPGGGNGDNFDKLMIPKEYIDTLRKGKDDKETIEHVKNFIRNEQIQNSDENVNSVVFISLENANREGSHSGFSNKYWNQLVETDELIGQLIEEYKEIWNKTLCIVMSDHGRSMDGKDCGLLTMDELITTLIFNGPGIEEGHQLYSSPISIKDIAPTILYSLCMTYPIQWRGRVIKEVFGEEDGWMYYEELGKNQDIINKFRILTPKKNIQKVVKYSISAVCIFSIFILELLILLLWFFMASERDRVRSEL